MAHYTDWLPTTREGQSAMAHNWQDVARTNAGVWGIPLAVLQNFYTLVSAADNALAAAKNGTTRTPAATAQCKKGPWGPLTSAFIP